MQQITNSIEDILNECTSTMKSRNDKELRLLWQQKSQTNVVGCMVETDHTPTVQALSVMSRTDMLAAT